MILIRLLSLALAVLINAINAEPLAVYTESLPPFQLIESNDVSGTATIKVKQLLESASLSYQIEVVPWARAYNIVRTTPNTLIYSMNRSPERELNFHWITTVAEIGNCFISLTNNKLNITQLEDAKNYLTAVVRDGYAYEYLNKNGFIADQNMYVVATLEQQISLLLNGKVDFLYTDIQSVQYHLSQHKLDPALVTLKYTQADWTHNLYLAANIDTDPKILQQLKNQFSGQ